MEHLDLPAYEQALSLNLTSAIVCAGAAIPSMRSRGGGSIMFTASVSGLVGSMFSPIYSAAKFAVVGLTKSLALKYGKEGIRVNVICPGLADTPMKSAFTSRAGDPEEARQNEARLIATVPMGRLCRPTRPRMPPFGSRQMKPRLSRASRFRSMGASPPADRANKRRRLLGG